MDNKWNAFSIKELYEYDSLNSHSQMQFSYFTNKFFFRSIEQQHLVLMIVACVRLHMLIILNSMRHSNIKVCIHIHICV
jgi:hypothetical protein